MADPFPSLSEYALAHRCPTCAAQPGVPCDAPNKTARLARADGIRTELGLASIEHDPIEWLHNTRQQTGIRHRRRDIGNAPWPEDRIPGQRYDSLTEGAP